MSVPGELIVLLAFDRDEDGELQPAFEPREMPDERRARQAALAMKERFAGVIAWVRDADPALGEFGPPAKDGPVSRCARRAPSYGRGGNRPTRESYRTEAAAMGGTAIYLLPRSVEATMKSVRRRRLHRWTLQRALPASCCARWRKSTRRNGRRSRL